MKQLLTFWLFCIVAFAAKAQQQNELAPDQNPDYQKSRSYYMGVKDSLVATMNTTAQQTYKAYDWYEEKMERKAERRRLRNERYRYNTYYGSYNNFNNYPYWNNGYYGPAYNNHWNNWGNRGWFNSFNYWRPAIGYRTGNWFFGF
jgi:hypothetical protein